MFFKELSIKNQWLSESALGKTRVTTIFCVISKMANEVGYKCKNCTFSNPLFS